MMDVLIGSEIFMLVVLGALAAYDYIGRHKKHNQH